MHILNGLLALLANRKWGSDPRSWKAGAERIYQVTRENCGYATQSSCGIVLRIVLTNLDSLSVAKNTTLWCIYVLTRFLRNIPFVRIGFLKKLISLHF